VSQDGLFGRVSSSRRRLRRPSSGAVEANTTAPDVGATKPSPERHVFDRATSTLVWLTVLHHLHLVEVLVRVVAFGSVWLHLTFYPALGFHWWLRLRARRGDELGRVGRFVANPWKFAPTVIMLWMVINVLEFHRPWP
jgi:hypothetical protein